MKRNHFTLIELLVVIAIIAILALMQRASLPRSRAFCRAGSSIEARIAMIAMTTRSSISVNGFGTFMVDSFLFLRQYGVFEKCILCIWV